MTGEGPGPNMRAVQYRQPRLNSQAHQVPNPYLVVPASNIGTYLGNKLINEPVQGGIGYGTGQVNHIV